MPRDERRQGRAAGAACTTAANARRAALFAAGAGGLNLYFAWLLLDQYLRTWRPPRTITGGYLEQTITVDYQDARLLRLLTARVGLPAKELP